MSTFRTDGYRDGFYYSPSGAQPEAGLGVPVYDAEYGEGFSDGVKDRSTVNGVKNFVVTMLDGESISQFEHVSDFMAWLETVNAYEAMDQDDRCIEVEPSDDLLAVVYEELCSEELGARAAAKKSSGMRM